MSSTILPSAAAGSWQWPRVTGAQASREQLRDSADGAGFDRVRGPAQARRCRGVSCLSYGGHQSCDGHWGPSGHSSRSGPRGWAVGGARRGSGGASCRKTMAICVCCILGSFSHPACPASSVARWPIRIGARGPSPVPTCPDGAFAAVRLSGQLCLVGRGLKSLDADVLAQVECWCIHPKRAAEASPVRTPDGTAAGGAARLRSPASRSRSGSGLSQPAGVAPRTRGQAAPMSCSAASRTAQWAASPASAESSTPTMIMPGGPHALGPFDPDRRLVEYAGRLVSNCRRGIGRQPRGPWSRRRAVL